jgi:hypothetical protein
MASVRTASQFAAVQFRRFAVPPLRSSRRALEAFPLIDVTTLQQTVNVPVTRLRIILDASVRPG